MSESFHCFEHAVDAIAAKHPGTPRQEVILTRLYYHVLPRLSAPLLAALKARQLSQLTISAPSDKHCLHLEIAASGLWKFWRKPQPLAALLATAPQPAATSP